MVHALQAEATSDDARAAWRSSGYSPRTEAWCNAPDFGGLPRQPAPPSDVQNTGVGVPKTNQPLPDGPVAQIRTPQNPTAPVEAKFLPDAQNAEMLVKAPAVNWGEKWGQLQNAGSELIQKRMAFLANGDKYGADQMDGIFQGVRQQQENVANYVFRTGARETKSSRVLKALDKSWATIMTGSGGLNYGKMQSVLQSGNTPQARAMETAFKSFASDDPGAMRAFNAMEGWRTLWDWKNDDPSRCRRGVG